MNIKERTHELNQQDRTTKSQVRSVQVRSEGMYSNRKPDPKKKEKGPSSLRQVLRHCTPHPSPSSSRTNAHPPGMPSTLQPKFGRTRYPSMHTLIPSTHFPIPSPSGHRTPLSCPHSPTTPD
ncbi:hypothetical protein K491DRAFT_95917 [Lophiostoma macrostomum CBS 122681]|uniref:Uncharacterized protein n=1 Tax=Lophiostoma macrostomum CBS 122681 TaxID=1314788 RepID=A0A6A6TJK2_9PLEO|nr:hypothetical protein K491DRAFT_95917 [Lophiostoma macrostomum CBS 122681]